MTAPKVHVLIPSRMASTRLPNKPLADICGKPMIVRVYEQAVKANVGPVTVACDDVRIKEVVEAAGGKAVLTNPDLPSGSDRIYEAMQILMQAGAEKPDIIINAQGDEPLLPPELLQQAVAPFTKNDWVDVVTFAHPITDEEEKTNPNMVKVCTNAQNKALYFSRSPIPHGAQVMKRHIGLYAYKYDVLADFVTKEPSPLEKQEKLEQLRAMEAGANYYVEMTDTAPVGVDTPADLTLVRHILQTNG